jgi:hypothetical protein
MKLKRHSTKMDMQQMMQQLLVNQEKAESNSKANKEDMLAKLQANRKATEKN